MLAAIDVHKFNALIEVNALINAEARDIHALLARILERTIDVCGADSGGLFLIDRGNRELFFEAVQGPKRDAIKDYTFKLMDKTLAGWVVRHNKSIIINDPARDGGRVSPVLEHIDYPAQTIMAAPLRNGEECIGVMEVLNKTEAGEAGFFSQDDLEWLEIFTTQASLAIQNARYMETLEKTGRVGEGGEGKDKEGRYHSLIAKSPAILEKLEIIDRIARTDSSVLILGESGVGKELFAEQIHLRSPRRDAPFVRVNCAALPEGLLESELFGHVKGAFTNAIQNRAGRFEAAHRGTIFLDEIGDLSLALQAKLLRVLQERTFEKIGSDLSVTVDVRVLAATNKDVEDLVRRGEFRNDLYYRLNVLPLYIPPLRQRPEDIPPLAEFFLRRYGREAGKDFEGFSDDALEAMLSYSWPGNIRELENCVQRACVTGVPPRVSREDLFVKQRQEVLEFERTRRDLKTAINLFKAHYIKKILEENNWNQTETAKALDIQRTYLSRLIKELEIINAKERVAC